MIHYDSSGKLYHLQSENCSYILRILPGGYPEHIYFGSRIEHRESYENLRPLPDLAFGASVLTESGDEGFSQHYRNLEYGTYGKGDFRNPSLSLCGGEGNRTFDFTFQRHEITYNKAELYGLPSSYSNPDEPVDSLVLFLQDKKFPGLELELVYAVFREKNVITRSVRLINGSSAVISIDKIASFSLDFDHFDYDLITLDGAWIRERHIHRRALDFGKTEISSRKGISSHDHSPFLVLCDKNADEDKGDAYGFALVYSGNHSCSVEVSSHGSSRLMMGINDFDFSWKLEPGESFQTPESVLVFSSSGLGGMSRIFHKFIRNNIVRGEWKFRERPVLINNWEATYFDFNEKKLLTLAKEAKTMGMELFVLDDGWFGQRNDDRSSLGDWYVNRKKLPGGIEGLSEKIRKIGLQFGIWVEPEMISMDSDLFRAHPDWMVRTPHREPSPGRFQFVLDFSNPEVCEYIFEAMSALFRSAEISYVKWDMNRSFSDIYSPVLPQDRQKEFSHRYILGLYSVLERLTKDFPFILFESCASGGGRFDLGIFCYMPQIWTSDDSDAMERLKIQEGSSLFVPPSLMGAHVSAVPNHQVMRQTPLETRFNVAAFGLLGYELDLSKLTNFEKKAMAKQIAFYKKYREILQFGEFYRLKGSPSGEIKLWMAVAQDRKIALLGYFQKNSSPNPGSERYRLKGLDAGAVYSLINRDQYIDIRQFGDLINMILPVEIKNEGLIHRTIADNYLYEVEKTDFLAGGDQLMNRGFVPVQQFYGTGLDGKTAFIGDFGSRLFLLNAKEYQTIIDS